MARFPFLATAATVFFSAAAWAQPLPDPAPRPAGFPPPGLGGTFARSPSSDCALTGLAVAVRARRTTAVIDVTARLKAVRGGVCTLLPQAVQVVTSRSIPTTRLLTVTAAEGQALLPMTLADAPGAADRPLPWARRLPPGSENVVGLRTIVEGETLPNGEVDGPARVRVDVSQLGVRLVAGAPLDVRVALEAGSAGRVTVSTGNARKPGVPQVTAPGGSLSLTQPLGKDDVIPMVEWRYEGDVPPPVTADGLAAGGLPVLEYLREGLARDLSVAVADPKNVKQVAAGWDTALTTSYLAAQIRDPLVAGLGLRALAWLSSALSYGMTDVKGTAETAREGAVVPEEILGDVHPALALFSTWSGRPTPPAPVSARTLRTLGPAFGEPNAFRKEADDAVKRLMKNRDAVKAAGQVGPVVSILGPVATLSSPPPKSLRLIDFGPKGAFVLGDRGADTIRWPLGHRLVHAFLRRPRPRFVLPAAVVFGALLGAIVIYYGSTRRREKQYA